VFRAFLLSLCLCCSRACSFPHAAILQPAKWIRHRAPSTPLARRAPIDMRPRNTTPRSRPLHARPKRCRLALNHALDARERAQDAAKKAADQQATLRSGAERRLGELTAMLDQANQRLAAAEAARVPRRTLMAPRAAIAAASASLQKAGTEIHDGDYQASQTRLSDSAVSLRAAIVEIDAASRGRGAKPHTVSRN
jgi:hypothetical protein